MKSMFIGGMFGVLIGLALSAEAARMAGDSGPLEGWFVEIGGTVVCANPTVFMDSQTIWCAKPPGEFYPRRYNR